METSLKEYLNSKPNAKTCIIDNNFKNRDYASITFKSNDLILYELVKNNHYTIDYIKGIVDNIRASINIKFSRKKEDNSFE